MIFTYKPEGAAAREWNFRVGKLLSPESEAIEKVTGLYIPQFREALENGSHSAARALLWVLLKRETPTLKYDEVQFAYDEFDIEFDLEEKGQIVANYDAAIAAGAPEPGPEFVAMMEAYRADLPKVEPEAAADLDAVEDPEAYEVEAPKAPSVEPRSESGTNGSSPATSAAPYLTSIV